MAYQRDGMPLMIFAGEEYGTGSSRDWAAKGTTLLGVKAVVAKSFERIHRANLVGMGVLPCQFKEGVDAATLKLDGSETFDLEGTESGITPQQDVTLVIHRADGKRGTRRAQAAHRYADRGGVLQQGRHSALRAGAVIGLSRGAARRHPARLCTQRMASPYSQS